MSLAYSSLMPIGIDIGIDVGAFYVGLSVKLICEKGNIAHLC